MKKKTKAILKDLDEVWKKKFPEQYYKSKEDVAADYKIWEASEEAERKLKESGKHWSNKKVTESNALLA